MRRVLGAPLDQKKKVVGELLDNAILVGLVEYVDLEVGDAQKGWHGTH